MWLEQLPWDQTLHRRSCQPQPCGIQADHIHKRRKKSLNSQSDHSTLHIGRISATIWSSPYNDSPRSHLWESTIQPEAHSQGGLYIDPRPDDYYVVLDSADEHSALEVETQKTSTMLGRLSQPLAGHKQYVRCARSELLDLMQWLLWLQTEPIDILIEPSLAIFEDYDDHGLLPEPDFDRCKRAVIHLLQTRSADEVQIAFLALCLASTSFRRLTISEITAGVLCVASVENTKIGRISQKAQSLPTEVSLENLCGNLIQHDKAGTISFQEPSMARFLRTVEIPGFDRGHSTMTQMCFEQIRRLGTVVIARPWYSFRRWFQSPSEWPLFNYVSKYWFAHYKLAPPSFTSELFRMINDALVGTSPTETPLLLQREVVDAGYDISQIYDLPRLACMYLNMGASKKSCSMRVASPSDWQQLRPLHTFDSTFEADTNLACWSSCAGYRSPEDSEEIAEITHQLGRTDLQTVTPTACEYDDHCATTFSVGMHEQEEQEDDWMAVISDCLIPETRSPISQEYEDWHFVTQSQEDFI